MRVVLVAAFAAVFSAATAGPKASFDCAKAGTPVEKLVCSDEGLAALDVQMAGVFGKLIAAHPADAAGIRDGQRAWLNERSQCAVSKKRRDDLARLTKSYHERMATLQGSAFVVCGKKQMAGNTFSIACKALNNPLQLSFTLTGIKGDMGDAQLAKLTVTKAGKTQVFKLDGQIFFDGLASALELMDINFDGFDDMKLATATSAGPNMSYEYWLYAPKSGQFTATKLGEQLSGFDVTPNTAAKTITVTGRSNCCSWNASTYGWNGAALRLHTSEDRGEFSPTDLPGLSPEQSLCGSETRHFNDAGLLTHIDLALGAADNYECSKETLAGQAKLPDVLKKTPKGYKIETEDKTHFAIVFDKPVKPAN